MQKKKIHYHIIFLSKYFPHTFNIALQAEMHYDLHLSTIGKKEACTKRK